MLKQQLNIVKQCCAVVSRFIIPNRPSLCSSDVTVQLHYGTQGLFTVECKLSYNKLTNFTHVKHFTRCNKCKESVEVTFHSATTALYTNANLTFVKQGKVGEMGW